MIFRRGLRMLGDREPALDATQDIFELRGPAAERAHDGRARQGAGRAVAIALPPGRYAVLKTTAEGYAERELETALVEAGLELYAKGGGQSDDAAVGLDPLEARVGVGPIFALGHGVGVRLHGELGAGLALQAAEFPLGDNTGAMGRGGRRRP